MVGSFNPLGVPHWGWTFHGYPHETTPVFLMCIVSPKKIEKSNPDQVVMNHKRLSFWGVL
jgi:Rad3-related DNA helicase